MLSDNNIKDIRLWLLAYDVATYEPSENDVARLSKDEMNTLNRCSVRRQKEFLLSRLLLRFVMEQQLSISTDDLSVIERESLPPLVPLAEEHNLHFSISHSHQLIGIATVRLNNKSPLPNIGLDLEYVKPVRDFTAINFFCNSTQQKTIDGFNDLHEKTSLYYLYWTQKEAYLKARQEGIANAELKATGFQALLGEQNADCLSANYIMSKPVADNDHYQISVYGCKPFQLSTYSVTLCRSGFSEQLQKLSLQWQSFALNL